MIRNSDIYRGYINALRIIDSLVELTAVLREIKACNILFHVGDYLEKEARKYTLKDKEVE